MASAAGTGRDSHAQASEACHNCRRLRHRCDRTVPGCRKCAAAGRECLGYGRLIRWTGAIASRGKWAGRTSNAPQEGTRGSKRRRKGKDEEARREDAADEQARWVSQDEEVASGGMDVVREDGDGRDGRVRERGDGFGLEAPDASALVVRTSGFVECAPRVLVDPVFQDMEPSRRYYLCYYTQRLCKDLVSLDVPESNPFRSLVAMTRGNPLLQHVIVAASAAHLANFHRATLCQPRPSKAVRALNAPPPLASTMLQSFTLDSPETNAHQHLLDSSGAPNTHQHLPLDSSGTLNNHQYPPLNSSASPNNHQYPPLDSSASPNIRYSPLDSHQYSPLDASTLDTFDETSLHSALQDASARAQHDALVAKTKALAYMRHAVANVDAVGGSDVVLAAAIFFINVELIESGKHGWKAHLEGAGRIMSLLQPAVGGNDTLRDYLLSDCFIYFILGSVFTPTAAFDPGPFFRSTQIPGIIERAANSYLCCPPELLAILYAASQLGDDAAAGLALFHRAQQFDIAEWAYRVCKLPYLRNSPVQSRIHAGTAHRLAACLYILQAVPALNAQDGLAEQLKAELFEHLALVPDDDPNFKATTWPTFIAGAEARSLDRREWIMDRLRRLVLACPWGFIFTSMDTLQFIWDLDSQGRRPSSWIQMLKDPDLNFLIV